MKIAVSGKGGVGKSTVSAALALTLARRGEIVLALDADMDANLASALGVPHAAQEKIVPVSERIELIEERTGATVNEYGRVFKLNPEVGDVADTLAAKYNGVLLLVLGSKKPGGSGCACPESTFIRALVTDLVLYKNQSLIMDMEAGVEHLGRATAQGVDVMIVVVEPGQRSVDCARSVIRMSGEIGIKRMIFVGNKVANPEDAEFIRGAFPGEKFAAMIPYSEALRNADRDGVSVLDACGAEIKQIFEKIIGEIEGALT